MNIKLIYNENYILLNNNLYELDQHQNYNKRDYFHLMENENDEPFEQHIHHLNQYHNYQ
jgi:hypothetical protein